LQDCPLCKSIWLALHVDSICVGSLWYICTCHYAHLLPLCLSAAIKIICCHHDHLLPLCSSAASMLICCHACPSPGLSQGGIQQNSPLHHWFTMQTSQVPAKIVLLHLQDDVQSSNCSVHISARAQKHCFCVHVLEFTDFQSAACGCKCRRHRVHT